MNGHRGRRPLTHWLITAKCGGICLSRKATLTRLKLWCDSKTFCLVLLSNEILQQNASTVYVKIKKMKRYIVAVINDGCHHYVLDFSCYFLLWSFHCSFVLCCSALPVYVSSLLYLVLGSPHLLLRSRYSTSSETPLWNWNSYCFLPIQPYSD